jgi:arylsulfatase A-like enzyme
MRRSSSSLIVERLAEARRTFRTAPLTWPIIGGLLVASTVMMATVGAQAQTPTDLAVALPKPATPFAGKIGRTAATSVADWPKAVTPPAHAPNILLVLTDDVGFAASSTFGGLIPTPNLDRLAARGLKYNEFHTTAMCSPTRAALLTGRNHQAVGTGLVVDISTGYPGYWSVIPKSAATVAEVLKDNGYNTAFFGKHHNVPAWQASAAGPFDLWPTGLGFEYFYGFIGGDNNQWQPKLYRNTTAVDDKTHGSGQTLDHELADEAIDWIHNQKAAAPDKPFFVYYAPGSGHAPHQAPPEWIARFKGKFDQGWDKTREDIFTRQKALGVIPADAALTPRPAALPAWDSLTVDQKRLDARYMEVFAAMLSYQDAQVGRVLDELDRMGQRDNTLVIFIEGDNGASGEGTPAGLTNEIGQFANGAHDNPGWLMDTMDHMGGPHSYELYPSGWAWAMDTPFQWMKQVASHLGGMRNGLVISWPDRIRQTGQVRPQFTHVIDIAPTILEAVGLHEPGAVNGVPQQRVDGTSLAYTFDDARAPTRHTTQYFEMIGNRAIYKDGWLANTKPRRLPWEMSAPAGDAETSYQWELYDLNHDYSQSKDLAAAQPEKLKALQTLWTSEAERNNVFPIDDSFGPTRAIKARVAHYSPRLNFVYWGKNISISDVAAPNVAARSFSLMADVVLPTDHETGVIAATGSWFGGWSFYLQNGKPVGLEAFSQQPQDQFRIASKVALPAGPATIRYDFAYDGGGLGKGGTLTISVNGHAVAQGRIDRTILVTAGLGETFDIGRDTGAPVSEDYKDQGLFSGEIRKVAVDLASFGGFGPALAKAHAEAAGHVQ